MAETIRINSLIKHHIEEYKKLKMEYAKQHFEEDIIYHQIYDNLKNGDEQSIILDAIGEAICHLKYDEKISL